MRSGCFGGPQPSRRIASNAGYAQAQLNLWDRLFMTGGVRQDSYNVFGDATTYRVTGGYLIKKRTQNSGRVMRPDSGRLRSTIFFARDSATLHVRPKKARALTRRQNQNLFQGRLQLTAGYFWNHCDDLIQFASVPSSLCPSIRLDSVRSIWQKRRAKDGNWASRRHS